MKPKKITFLLISLVTLVLGGAAIFTAWKLSQPETTTTPEPSEAAVGGGENCNLTFTVTESDLRIKKYVKVKGTEAWYSDTVSNVPGVTVGPLEVAPGGTVVWKVVVWNTGDAEISASSTDSYTNTLLYTSFAGEAPSGTGPGFDWGVIPIGGSEVASFADANYYREFEAVVGSEEALLSGLGAGTHTSKNTVSVVDAGLAASATITTTVTSPGEPNLRIKKYVRLAGSSVWHDVEINVDSGAGVEWKVVVWNTGDAAAESVYVADGYTQESLYRSFEGDANLDGEMDSYLDFGTVAAGTTEATGVVRTFAAATKSDLAVGDHRSVNTATIVGTDKSDEAAMAITVSEEEEEDDEEEEPVVPVPPKPTPPASYPTGSREGLLIILVSLALITLGALAVL